MFSFQYKSLCISYLSRLNTNVHIASELGHQAGLHALAKVLEQLGCKCLQRGGSRVLMRWGSPSGYGQLTLHPPLLLLLLLGLVDDSDLSWSIRGTLVRKPGLLVE